jgi:hypothetical protein
MIPAPQLVGWRRRAVLVAGPCLLMSGGPPAAAQEPTGFAMTYSSFSAWTDRCSAVHGIVGREPAGQVATWFTRPQSFSARARGARG